MSEKQSEKTNANGKPSAIGKTVGATVTTDKLVEKPVPGGVLVTNETTGAQYLLFDNGERVDVVAAKPEPPAPEKPKPVAGKLVIGDDGVHRFVPDDGSDPLDLTKSIEARDAEARKTPQEKALDELNKTFTRERDRVQALATPEERERALQAQVQQQQQQLQIMAGVKVRYENTILGMSLLLSSSQLPQG
jgi:hypothetical protein